MFFVSPKNLFLFWRHINFSSEFFGHVGKRLDKKAKANIEISDVTTEVSNNYITPIAQYIKKLSQSNYEIWWVNRV